MKQPLYRIIDAVYNKPWLLLPSAHRSIVQQLQSHINSPTTTVPNLIEMEPDEPDQEEIDLESLIEEMETGTAIVSVEGIIGKRLSMLETMCGGVDLDEVTNQLRQARDNPEVTNILLYFNSPGGTVTGVREAGEVIKEVNAVKPIIGYSDTVCASAAYWLASQCSAFYCAASADIGSVGVYSIFMDYSKQLENEGIKVNAIYSGKWKLAGADFKPMTDEEKQMFKADIDGIHAQFNAAVLSNREIKLEYLVDSNVFRGEAAVMNNFADGIISSLDDMLSFINGMQLKI